MIMIISKIMITTTTITTIMKRVRKIINETIFMWDEIFKNDIKADMAIAVRVVVTSSQTKECEYK